MIIVRELGNLLNSSGGIRKTFEYSADVGTILHGDDTELILLINPDKECLGIIMEDTTATGPVAVHTSSFKETIALLEKEVVFDKLLLSILVHAGQRVVSSLELTFERLESLNGSLFNSVTLFFGDTGAERVVSKVTADTDTSRFDHLGLILRKRGGIKLGAVHVGHMFSILGVTMVVKNDLVHERSEVGVTFVRASIDTNTRV